MDGITIFFKALELIPRFIPKAKPPVIDYTGLVDKLPRYPVPEIRGTEVAVVSRPEPYVPSPTLEPVEETEAVVVETPSPAKTEVSTACLSCSRSHLSTVSGALNESLRFARDGGVRHPEVQRRLMMAEDEINMLERIDLAADALSKAGPEERKVAEEFLPKIRKLRQDIGDITTVPQLQDTAAEASVLGQEFRLRHLQLRGVDLNPVMDLAKRVQAGEITMAEAKAKLKTLLPDER